MDFASPYILMGKKEEDDEEIFADELGAGWDVSIPVTMEQDLSDTMAAGPEASQSAAPAFGPAFGAVAPAFDSFDAAPESCPAPPSVSGPAAPAFGSFRRKASSGKAAAAPPPAAAAPPPPPAPNKAGILGSLSSWGGFVGKGKTHTPSPAVAQQKKVKMQFSKSTPAPDYKTPSYKQNVDSNIVVVKMARLKEKVSIHSGDITKCTGCNAVLSAISRIAIDADVSRWPCEFCRHVTVTDLVKEELPVSDSVDYILRPARAVQASEDDRRIIFCIDTSGSMCVSTEVPGRFEMKGGDLRSRRERELNEDRSSQYIPGQRRDVTYVSRLQSMQAAIESQLASMSELYPNRRVGIVTFNSSVQIIGDGSQPVVDISGDRLSSQEELLQAGQGSPSLTIPIKDARQALSAKLFSLEEGGQTGLGPALLVAIEMAAQKAGSQVIVCTDGLANIGLGSLEGFDQLSDADKNAVEGFYAEAARKAKASGVAVSLISIEGQECKLEQLSTVADITGGDIERVNPLQLKDNFQAMLANPIIATNVSITMLLHSRMAFRNEDSTRNCITRELGSVTEDNEVYFEFFMKPVAPPVVSGKAPAVVEPSRGPVPEGSALDGCAVPMEGCAAPAEGGVAEAAAGAGAGDLREVPFQVQIRFTLPDGMEVLRVLSQMKPLTADRVVADRDVNIAILAANAAQSSARLAQEGKYESARVNAYAWRSHMARTVTSESSTVQQQHQFSNYCSAMSEVDTTIRQAQVSEGADMQAMEEDTRSRARRHARSDTDSRTVFKCKNVKSDHFT